MYKWTYIIFLEDIYTGATARGHRGFLARMLYNKHDIQYRHTILVGNPRHVDNQVSKEIPTLRSLRHEDPISSWTIHSSNLESLQKRSTWREGNNCRWRKNVRPKIFQPYSCNNKVSKTWNMSLTLNEESLKAGLKVQDTTEQGTVSIKAERFQESIASSF